jgi:myosin heavy subunit
VTVPLCARARLVSASPHGAPDRLLFSVYSYPPSTGPSSSSSSRVALRFLRRYLAHGDPNPAKHDVPAWGELAKALSAQAISEQEQWLWWQMVAAILLLGNVQFDESKPDAATVVSGAKGYLGECETLLGLNKGTFEKALTKRKIKAGAEFVEQDLKSSQANDSRDALSKAIYSRLFDYLILKINQALVAGGSSITDDMKIIGIVDIFGFEVFKVNSLEQVRPLLSSATWV